MRFWSGGGRRSLGQLIGIGADGHLSVRLEAPAVGGDVIFGDIGGLAEVDFGERVPELRLVLEFSHGLGEHFAEHLSIENNKPVLYFSMGLSKEQLLERLILGRATVDLRRAHENRLEAIIVERFADLMMLISRERYYGFCPSASDEAQITCTRNRNGSTFITPLTFNESLVRFESAF